MEVKMNKEIMEYREAMFFGLDFRQMVCSLLAVLSAVGIYFSLRDMAGDEITGWLCMAGAVPFAFCGFFRYHGMTAEQFAWAFMKSEFLYPKRLLFRPEDIYYQCMEERITSGAAGKRKRKEQTRRRKKNSRRNRSKISVKRKCVNRKQMKKRKQAQKKNRNENRNPKRLELDRGQKSQKKRPELDRRQKSQRNRQGLERRQKIQRNQPDSRKRKRRDAVD